METFTGNVEPGNLINYVNESYMETFTGNVEPGNLINYVNERRAKFLGGLPSGYRFAPRPADLILKYLIPKINNARMPNYHDIVIPEVNIYLHNPNYLITEHALDPCAGEMYFMTTRERKYRGGCRPSRSAGDGYWKPVGRDEVIIHKGKQIGLKKVLDFYLGEAKKGGIKTEWKMHEYKIEKEKTKKTIKDPLKLDAWVVSKIYKTGTSKNVEKGNNTTGDDSNEAGPSQLNDSFYLNGAGPSQLNDSFDTMEEDSFMNLSYDLPHNSGPGGFSDHQNSGLFYYDPSSMGGNF